MKLPFFKSLIDERFLMHRLRSSSLGGLAGAAAATALFEYRLLRDDAFSRDLLAVLVVMVVVKLTTLTWYRFRD
jgi:hypothetical protein